MKLSSILPFMALAIATAIPGTVRTDATAAGAAGVTVEANNDRELEEKYIYLPRGSATWDKCAYEKTVLSNSGGYGHADIYCDLPVEYYRYHEIVSFHAVPSRNWDGDKNHLDCWFGSDSHGNTMLHCDHDINRGRVKLHMLCCHGNQVFDSFDMQPRLEKTGPEVPRGADEP
jgi:hypothetical protein